jgi:hypothetical protein
LERQTKNSTTLDGRQPRGRRRDQSQRGSRGNLRAVFISIPLGSVLDQINKQLKFPSKLDIDRLRRQVVEYCATKKILCLDLTARSNAQQAKTNSSISAPTAIGIKKGHRVVAQAIREFLTAAGVAG